MPDRAAIAGVDEPLLRARELFEAASTEQGAEREAILSQGCHGDVKLRSLVESLIRASEGPHAILDAPLSLAASRDCPSASTLSPGTPIGAYRVVKEIGSGGMGTVYLAETTQGFYAIKVMRWSSPELARRFQQEQSILRCLQHPNIARLVESGMVDGHSPYPVMEYVEGQPIHRYCEQNSATVDERLRLFGQVCGAVRYLHRNLVIHRDLKPSNILVTADGTAKLLDFGIAKLLEPSGNSASLVHTSLGLMTPDYASPEQIRGSAISTLTDVYSLGVLLYELLTGIQPFVETRAAMHETLRRVCEEEPVRPSAAIARAPLERGVRRGLARKLRGELDNVILKAMRKDPERRYVSVEQFDEDVRSYLDGLPVLAQGDTLLYRVGKFVKRHKAGVAAGAAMVALLTGGVVATSLERARAEAEAREARLATALAENRAREAQQQRIRAEQQAAEAQRERANAERRLEQLQKLARGAIEIYTSTGQSNLPPAAAARIAENARDSLRTLNAETALDPRLTGLLDETSAAVASYGLAAGESWQVPAGWSAQQTGTNEYRVGLDRQVLYQGKPALFLRSLAPEPAGTVRVFQAFAAGRYRGKRVRLAGFLRTQQVATAASLWLRIDGTDPETGALENIPISGSGPWKRREIVMDLPADAEMIEFGISMTGTGTVWAAHFRFEQVSRAIPLTGRQKPANLDFMKPTNKN